VGIEDEGAIVVLVIVRTQPGGPVVLAACRERRAIEGVDLLPVSCSKRDVLARLGGGALAEPEIHVWRDAVTDDHLAPSELQRDRHPLRIAERRERLLVESPADGGTTHVHSGVIDHHRMSALGGPAIQAPSAVRKAKHAASGAGAPGLAAPMARAEAAW